jgi:integrase
LKPWLARTKEEDYLFRPALHGKKRAESYTESLYAHVVKRVAQSVGVKGFQAYQCRHAAKDRVASSAGIHAAMKMLGHKSISMTQEYGTELDLPELSQIARRHS